MIEFPSAMSYRNLFLLDRSLPVQLLLQLSIRVLVGWFVPFPIGEKVTEMENRFI